MRQFGGGVFGGILRVFHCLFGGVCFCFGGLGALTLNRMLAGVCVIVFELKTCQS